MDGSLTSPTAPIRTLATITVDDEQHLAAGCDDGMIRLWGLLHGRPRAFAAHGGPVLAMSVLRVKEQDLLATGGDDRAARIWVPATGKRLRNFAAHVDAVRAVCALTVDGRRLLAAANYKNVTLWSRSSGYRDRGLTVARDSAVRALATVSVGGRTCLAIATVDGDILVWDFADDRLTIVLTGHTATVNAAHTVTIDEHEFLATVSSDRTIRLWDLAAAEVQRREKSRVSAACAMRLHSRRLAAIVADDRSSIRLLDVETGADAGFVGKVPGVVAGLCAVTGGESDLIASASDRGLIQIWNPRTAQQLFDRARTVDPLRAICPFQDGDGRVLLAVAGDRRTALRLVHPGAGRVFPRRMGGWFLAEDAYEHLRVMRLMHQVSADTLATAGDDPAVMLWRSDGRRIRVLKGHKDGVRALATVLAGAKPLLATGSDDQTVRLWNPADGSLVTTLGGHGYGVTALCPVTVAGRTMLVSGSRDRTVRVWDFAERNAVLTIPVHYPVTACLEVSGLLFVGLTAGSLALDLDAGRNELAHFRRA
jgi:WD40 repeat protein